MLLLACKYKNTDVINLVLAIDLYYVNFLAKSLTKKTPVFQEIIKKAR